MTPKQKENDLIHKFLSNALPDAVECDLNVGRLCALIAVEEILAELKKFDIMNEYANKRIYYYNKVKTILLSSLT